MSDLNGCVWQVVGNGRRKRRAGGRDSLAERPTLSYTTHQRTARLLSFRLSHVFYGQDLQCVPLALTRFHQGLPFCTASCSRLARPRTYSISSQRVEKLSCDAPQNKPEFPLHAGYTGSTQMRTSADTSDLVKGVSSAIRPDCRYH